MASNYKCRILGEADLGLIRDYLHRLTDNTGKADHFIYFNPMYCSDLLDEVSLRYQLYNYAGEFVAVESDGEIRQIFGFLCSNSYNSSVQNVSFFASSIGMDLLGETLDYAAEALLSKAIRPPGKLRIILPEKSEFKNMIEQMGFQFEFRSRDELGWNLSVEIYSKYICPVSNREISAFSCFDLLNSPID